MKIKEIAHCITISLFFINAVAQPRYSFLSGSIRTASNEEIIEYKYRSLQAITEGLESLPKEISCHESKPKKSLYEVTIELRILLQTKNATSITSQRIKTKCITDSITIAINKLRAVLRTAGS